MLKTAFRITRHRALTSRDCVHRIILHQTKFRCNMVILVLTVFQFKRLRTSYKTKIGQVTFQIFEKKKRQFTKPMAFSGEI